MSNKNQSSRQKILCQDFPVVSISRIDLIDIGFDEDEVLALTGAQMEILASEMRDSISKQFYDSIPKNMRQCFSMTPVEVEDDNC